jgi:dipeptidyl aminopeptidase/acylaminoacyl peptidase
VATATAAPSAESAKEVSADPTALTVAQAARDKALAPKVEAIVDAFGNFDAQLSKDGKKVLFRSNRGGLPEVYVGEVGKPGEAPKKVVGSVLLLAGEAPGASERVASAVFTRDGKHILFRRDRGADENFHILRCDAEGGGMVDLTPSGTLHRGDPLLPRKVADTFFYTARDTTSAETKLFVQKVAGGEPKVVYVDPSPAFGVDVSPDGKHALLLRSLSPSDQVVFDVDVAAGKAARVFPAEGKRAGVQAASFSADGNAVLVATDEGGETHSVLALDEKTHAETARYTQKEPPTAHVDGIEVSPRGDLIVINVDAGHHREARVLSARKLEEKGTVKAPLGTVGIGPFAEDGKSFTLFESLPDKPADIYRVDAATFAVEPLRDDKRPGLGALPPLSVAIETIKAFDGLSIPLNVYLPKGLPAGQRLPVIAEFHGGPASSSTIGWNLFARFFTSQGFALVEPNIRGSTGFGRAYEMADNREKRGDALKDVASVNAWIKAQPWADPERVVIFGGSYGGYLVLMGLTRQPSLWRAGVDLVGVANLFTFLKSTDQTIRSIFVDEFGDLEKDQKLLEEYSPLRDAEKIVAPLFVYQGANDPRVPRPESDQVVRGLRARKIPVEYMVAMNEGHSIDRRETRVELLTRVARFLDDEMKAPR